MNSALSVHGDIPRQTIKRKRLITVAAAVTAVAIAFAVVRFQHWDDRLYFYLKSQVNASEWAGKSLWLPDYKVKIDAKPIAGLEQNLSSIVYDHDQDRLLAISNGPSELVALNKVGEIIAHYPLVGFGDIEGIDYMGDGLVVMADERAQELSFIQLPSQPGELNIKDAQYLSLGINLNGNKGFEGVSYDAANDRLFVVKERDPRQLYEVTGIKASLAGGLQLRINDLTHWIDQKVFATDLSAVHFDPVTGHLAILSDESKLLVELSGEGKFVSFRTFLGGFSDLKKTAPQAEGVTMDRDGNLYMVSEPNLFYMFSKD